MKIGILYIATGKYACFWDEFYNSAEKYLFPDDEKHYFVFTDSPEIKGENVTVYHRECQGFPADTLFRFEMFLSIKAQLLEMDYIFFFNANAVIKQRVSEDIIPGEKNYYLMCVIHSMESIKKLPVMYFTYERNKKSLAYIPPFSRPQYHYYQGCLNGGRSREFVDLCEKMAKNIRIDYDNGIIACFHDESHINRYFRDFPPLALGREYVVPEGYENKINCKIMFRDKEKISEYFRKNKKGLVAKISRVIRKTLSGIKWYLKI